VDGFNVSYHTGGNWIVTTPWSKEITFLQEENDVCRRFPYIDMQSMDTVAMIQTVCQCYKGLTKHEVKDAIVVHKTQAMTVHPNDTHSMEMVRNNTIKNCLIKPVHITNTLSIFSPSIVGVHGKTVRYKPEQVEAELGCIPDDIHHLHRFVVTTADMMFINGIAVLTMLSWKLRLATVKQLPLHTTTQLSNSLMKIVRPYACVGFIFLIIMMDQGFNKVKDACKMVKLNTSAACKHVGEIERHIQTVKEHSQALVLDLSYTKLPCQVVIHLVYFAVLWLNSLPAAAGVSDKYSPHKIILGHKLDFKKHRKATFGSYVKAIGDPTITYTIHPHTFPGIFLGPTGSC
jgi:hypothetical protein